MIPVSLNPRVRGLPHPTPAVSKRSRTLLREGRRVFRFGHGQSPFPVPESVVNALRHHVPRKDPPPVEGLLPLREAVARFHRQRDGVRARPEDVLIGPGARELMLLMQLVFSGKLLVSTPCWTSYASQARILGREVVTLPSTLKERWRLSPERLQALCRSDGDGPRLLILSSPGNPSGGTHREGNLQALAQVARKHNIIILSDESDALLHHRGEHVSIARYYPEGTIISGGLSTWCGEGRGRLGSFTFPEALGWLRDAMISVASETHTPVSSPIQYAAATAFRGGIEIEHYLTHARRILSALGLFVADRLREAGVQVLPPEGGFYLMLDFSSLSGGLAARGITGGQMLCELLLEERGVALLPGVCFERPREELTARLAYVDFDGARALAASALRPLERDLSPAFLKQYCQPVVRGVDMLLDWLDALPKPAPTGSRQ